MHRWAVVFVLLGGCFVQERMDREERRKKDLEEHIRRKSEEMQAKKIAEDARRYDEEQAKDAQAKDDRELNKEMARARALDGEALKKARGKFAASLKGQLGCSLSQVEGKDQDVLHVEGCSLGTPGVAKERFQTMKNLEFWVLHSSQGKAKCSYFMSNFPPVVTAQSIWKCNVGDAWPTQ